MCKMVRTSAIMDFMRLLNVVCVSQMEMEDYSSSPSQANESKSNLLLRFFPSTSTKSIWYSVVYDEHPCSCYGTREQGDCEIFGVSETRNGNTDTMACVLCYTSRSSQQRGYPQNAMWEIGGCCLNRTQKTKPADTRKCSAKDEELSTIRISPWLDVGHEHYKLAKDSATNRTSGWTIGNRRDPRWFVRLSRLEKRYTFTSE